MKYLKKILKWCLWIALIPIAYILVSLILSNISVNTTTESDNEEKTIFLTTNGVHLDIVLPIVEVDENLIDDLEVGAHARYLAFGWGDKDFYLHTPTWKDLTFKNAFKAAFLKSSTLMHLTNYSQVKSSWTPVQISKKKLLALNKYIDRFFVKSKEGQKIMLMNEGYTAYDQFYEAKGSYSCLMTCNTWVNSAFKESGLKACFWTPFDFGLLKQYDNTSISFNTK